MSICFFLIDRFIDKQLIRFKINRDKIRLKSLVRSYHEIRLNLSNTKYIHNFDNYSIIEKRRVLKRIFRVKTKLMTPVEIEYHFNRKIYQSVKELEKDLAKNS